MKGQDVYKEVRTFTFPNAIIRVHIPDLTEDERKKRIKAVAKAAGNLLKTS